MRLIRTDVASLDRVRHALTAMTEGLASPGRHPKVTLGTFDGVHVGHQEVLRQLGAWAAGTSSPSVIITFDRRPREALGRSAPDHITSLRHRLLLMERFRIDAAVVLTFDAELAAWAPERFVREVILGAAGADGVLLGHDTRFGHGARGDVALLERLARRHGFEVCSVPVVMLDGAPVSSTRVRQALQAGDLDQAARLLQRPVSTLGTVVRGTGRGKGLGVPTANLDLHHEVRLPEGVYATRTGFEGRWYASVTNIGRPPSFESGGAPYLSEEVATETYLLDFREEIYGKEIEVRFLAHLREEYHFASPAALKKAIARDVAAARPYHARDTDEPEPLV
jgi:riboflavin kinase/FMN adenylyltransferase